jgi:hypothetical protein
MTDKAAFGQAPEAGNSLDQFNSKGEVACHWVS